MVACLIGTNPWSRSLFFYRLIITGIPLEDEGRGNMSPNNRGRRRDGNWEVEVLN